EDPDATDLAPHAAAADRPRGGEPPRDLVEREAERRAHGGGGERVDRVVASGEGERHGLQRVRRLEREPEAVRVLDDVAHEADLRRRRAPVGDDVGLGVARHPGDARVVGVEREPAGGGHGAHERRLLLVHAIERAEELRVDGRHVRHDAERRPRQLRQVGDLAGPVGAELEHERLVLGDEPEEREREPPLVVEARRGLEDLPARAADAHAERARVDRHPRHGDAEVTRDQRAPRRANDVLDGEQWHPSSYRERSRRIRRATSRSSKGSTSEPTIWYVSWPLPATTTVSPASAQCSAARIARERSGSTAYRPGPAPASRTPTMISSMIPSGRSERGLSEVTQTRSAR